MPIEPGPPVMLPFFPPALRTADARRRARGWLCGLMAWVLLLQGLIATQVQIVGRWHHHVPVSQSGPHLVWPVELGTVVSHWLDHALQHDHRHAPASGHRHGQEHDHEHGVAALHPHSADDASVQPVAAGDEAEFRLGTLASALGPLQPAQAALALRSDGHVWNAASTWRARNIDLEPPRKPPRTA